MQTVDNSQTWWASLNPATQKVLLKKHKNAAKVKPAEIFTMWYKEVVKKWWDELGNDVSYLIRKYIKKSGRIDEWQILSIYEKEVIEVKPLPDTTDNILASETTAGKNIRYHFRVISKLNEKVIFYSSMPSEGGRAGFRGYKSPEIANEYGKEKKNNIPQDKNMYYVKVVPMI